MMESNAAFVVAADVVSMLDSLELMPLGSLTVLAVVALAVVLRTK